MTTSTTPFERGRYHHHLRRLEKGEIKEANKFYVQSGKREYELQTHLGGIKLYGKTYTRNRLDFMRNFVLKILMIQFNYQTINYPLLAIADLFDENKCGCFAEVFKALLPYHKAPYKGVKTAGGKALAVCLRKYTVTSKIPSCPSGDNKK
jgi:hypothetical protein